MFARLNFCELQAELKSCIFNSANDCWIINISYIAILLVLMFTLLSVQEDGGIVWFCELRAQIPCVSRDLDCNGGRNADLRTNEFTWSSSSLPSSIRVCAIRETKRQGLPLCFSNSTDSETSLPSFQRDSNFFWYAVTQPYGRYFPTLLNS